MVNVFLINICPVESFARQMQGERRIARQPAKDMMLMGAVSPIDPCQPFTNYTNNKFFSPSYPGGETYTNNTDCVLVLKAPPGHLIKLDFRDWFQIEDSPDCKNDFLEVRDGYHGYNALLEGPFCGIDVFPPMLTSSDRYMWIHFKSDENIEYKGFKAVFEFIPRPASSARPEIIPCAYEIVDLEEGTFGRSNISQDLLQFDLQNDIPIDCLWEVTVRKNWRIYLQFEQFNLERPNDCDSNFVQVFSEKTDVPSQEKIFCGSMADTVLSKGNRMFVRFFSISKGPKTTFFCNFTAFRDLGTAKHECENEDEFYCEDATCIHKSLECNARFNCRFRWDEDQCQSTTTAIWTGQHIIIIMVIFSLILTGMCITFIYNCITKLIRDHQTIQEYIRQSREQQLNELDKQEQPEKKASSKVGSRSRSHSSPSIDSQRFDAVNAVNTPCYVPGGDILPILIRNEHSMSPSNGDAYNTNIYTVDNDNPPEMCDSACQTRESLFTQQGYSSGNSTPNHSVSHTDSPPAPFSTFGYKKDTRFKAEAKIEVTTNKHELQEKRAKYESQRRPYSVQTTKSAPDVIVTH